MSRRTGGPLAMSTLIGATLGKNRLGYGVQRARALLLWPQAAGADIARMTRPRSVQGGTLFIEVRDSAAAHHLSMQRHHFLKRLNELLGEGQHVTELRFSVGQIRPAPDAPRAAPLPAPDRARARTLVQGVQGVDDPEVQAAALKAAEAVTRAIETVLAPYRDRELTDDLRAVQLQLNLFPILTSATATTDDAAAPTDTHTDPEKETP